MSSFSVDSKFPSEIPTLSGSSLDINAVHFTNQILLQIRLNGEVDVTYEVTKRGLNSIDQNRQRPIAGYAIIDEEEDDEEDEMSFGAIRDNLSDYQVVAKLGDANDTKIPVICTQIAELYTSVLIPFLKEIRPEMTDVANGDSLLITLSSKIWRNAKGEETNNDTDFGKLVFILKTLKEMYTN